ncbi:putative type VI secretion system effector [uncultured Acinetobacter sp.]|nr:putative type VI secretion system effector [uncultured Acinetobacter sp.]
MKIVEGKVKNLKIQKTKYEVLKNNGKQATLSSALGAAVGSAALASQAVLLMNASIDVESITFTLNGEEFEGIFNEIYLKEGSKVICLVEANTVLVVIDPQQDLIYMPIGTGETIYNLKRKYIKYFFIFYFVVLFLALFSGVIFIQTVGSVLSIFVCLFIVFWMYKDEKNKGLLTERIFELLNFKHFEGVNLDKFTYKDKDGFTVSWVYHYQHAFKQNNPYPKDYFEKK